MLRVVVSGGHRHGDSREPGGLHRLWPRRLLIATRVGRVKGIKALERMLQWEEGRFEFYARIDPDIERDAPTYLKGSVLEAMASLVDLEVLILEWVWK